VSLRWTLGTASALLAALLVLGLVFETGDEQVLVDGPLELPSEPASERPISGRESTPGAVQITPEVEIDGPTTVEVTLTRGRKEGWVGVSCALVSRDTGDVRQFGVSTDWRDKPGGGSTGTLENSARIDQVEGGRYVIRLAPTWQPVEAPVAPGGEAAEPEAPEPPGARIRVVAGGRSPLTFSLAAGLILLPALVQIVRWAIHRRRAQGAGADPAGPPATATGEEAGGS